MYLNSYLHRIAHLEVDANVSKCNLHAYMQRRSNNCHDLDSIVPMSVVKCPCMAFVFTTSESSIYRYFQVNRKTTPTYT